jgi:hypothetical protein
MNDFSDHFPAPFITFANLRIRFNIKDEARNKNYR